MNAEFVATFTEIFDHFGVRWNLLIAQMINFCLVAFVLYRFAFKPILKTLDRRQQRIAEGLQYAEEMKAKLADAEKQHASILQNAFLEGQGIIEKTKKSAEKHYEQTLKETTEKAESILKKTGKEIEWKHRQMLQESRKEITHLVVETTQKVLSRELSEEDRQRFTQSATAEFFSN